MITVHEAFSEACLRWPEHAFLLELGSGGTVGRTLSFAEVASMANALSGKLQQAGFGLGHRVAVMQGNRSEHFVAHLALNALGVSIVPLNPDLTTQELAYVLEHSEADAVIVAKAWQESVQKAVVTLPYTLLLVDTDADVFAPPRRANVHGSIGLSGEAGLFYTSGTTGRPKGCIISNAYYLRIGQAYAHAGGLIAIHPATERILNPLPVFHQNAGIFSFMCAVLSGSCLVLTDRFHASTWWQDVVGSGATIIHYLGVMPAILLKLAVCEAEQQHRVRFGIGAGVEPSLHQPFEERFGFPLIELWGMTEVGCGFIANRLPRQLGTRAVGGPQADQPQDLEIRLVDEQEQDVLLGTVGELLVRRKGEHRAQGMFSGYLKDPEATEQAWRGGWFHTGDVFWQSEDGTLHFAERKKNIIRRSGENIAAAEIEAVLLNHPSVANAAVIAVTDELREEEVMACVVPANAGDDAALADALFDWCMQQLTYYKAPGWIVLLDAIPVTNTQKVQKARIFDAGEDPRKHPRAIDMRSRKKRQPQSL